DDADITEWEERAAGSVRLRIPRLMPAHVSRMADGLRAAQVRLRDQSVDSIIDVIDRVAHRLLDQGDPLRVAADTALPPLTGYSPAMIEHILDGMAADWRRPALERLVEAELGGADVLDGPVVRYGWRVMDVPHPLPHFLFAVITLSV